MKFINAIGACVVVAAVSGALAFASLADAFEQGFGPLAGSPFPDSTPSQFSPKALAVLTDQGISPERARQALRLQGQVAETNLPSRIEAALAGDYAGVWFEPAAAKFHIGVTSDASRRAAMQVVAQTGLTADVVLTPVRSTLATLVAVQTRWGKKLAKLLADQQATTGLDSSRNAVSITLSSAVQARERAAIEREAVNANANVFVTIVPPSQLRLEPAATCKFETSKAYCEKTIVSGVTIITPSNQCTAGPLLVSGKETYMLTAGHCFGPKNNEGRRVIAEKTTSSYPAGGGQKEIGKEGSFYYNENRDMAEVKVVSPEGPFSTALPSPVPALMAEWGKKTETPSQVIGEAANIIGQTNCHQGQTSGEQCGKVIELNIEAGGVKHLVKDTACGELGDSGGPFYLETESKVNNVYMQGVLVTAAVEKKCSEGEKNSSYEPLKNLEGAPGLGILSTFAGQRLLTTATENRTKNEEKEAEEAKAGPFWSIGGTRLKVGQTHNITAKAFSASFRLSTPAAGVEIACEKVTVKDGVLLGSESGTEGKNSEVAELSGSCAVTGNGTSCKVTEPIVTEPLLSELVDNVEKSGVGKKLLVLFAPISGTKFATLKFTGTCTVKETKATGNVAAEVLTDPGEETVELGQSAKQAASWLLKYPETPVTEVWLVSGGAGKVVNVELTAFGDSSAEIGTVLVSLANSKFETEKIEWSPLP
jgi:Trypsin